MRDEEKSRAELLKELADVKRKLRDFESHQNQNVFHFSEGQEEGNEDFGSKFAEVAGVILLVLRSDESIGYINSFGSNLLEYSPAEVLNRNWFDTCLPADFREDTRQVFEQIMSGDRPVDNYYMNSVLTKTGKIKVIYWHNFALLDKKGNINAVICSGEDRTEQVEREKKLFFQEWLLKSTREAISAFDPQGRVMYWGPGAEAEFGFGQDEVMGKTITLGAEERTLEKVNLRQSRIERNEKWEEEYLVRRKNGEVFWTAAFFSPLYNENGEILGCIRIDRNVSERKLKEFKLKNSLESVSQKEKEMSALLNSAKALLEHKYFSEAAEAIFEECRRLIGADSGYILRFTADKIKTEILHIHFGHQVSEKYLSGKEMKNLVLPMRGLREKVFESGNTIRINNFQKNKFASGLPAQHIQIENLILVPLKVNNDIVGILGLANKPGGFTEKDAELSSAFGELASVAYQNSQVVSALEKSETLLRSLIESAKEAIISIDPDGEIIIWNNAAEILFGYSFAEVQRKPVSLIIPPEYHSFHDPETFNKAMMKLSEKILGETIELEMINKEGSRIPVELSLSIWRVGGEEFSMGIIQDISERKRKRKEREELINELQRINHELDQFTYTVSHDLKSPLITIQGFAGFLEEDLKKNNLEQMKNDITEINLAAAKMKSLVDELLELSRLGRVTNPWTNIDYQDLVESAVQSVSGRLTQRKIQVIIQPDLPVIYGDNLRLRQVLENLIDNAAKFMGDEPDPEIHIGFRWNGEQKVFFVADNGIGVRQEYSERIFNLFEKLNQNSEGSGFGLTFVKRIIELHNGEIWVESGIDQKGTTFCFTLPEPPEDSRSIS